MSAYAVKYGIFPPQITIPPSSRLGLVVVIPCYNEPTVLKSLQALKNCTLPTIDVEVILLINNSVQATPIIKGKNKQTYEDTSAWAIANSSTRLQFHILLQDALPHKHAGVGLARKIGMDEALYRLEAAGKEDGILLCFDADSNCLPNYFIEVEKHFETFPNTPACSIHYEHPIEGTEFAPSIYQYIIDYELHLRYYMHALRYAGFPLAFQTIGSSMAVRASAYQKQGGMNRRKAGEDFYFLHKFIPSGRFTELKSTMVIPSPRPSDRVPFGTGRAVVKLQEADDKTYFTYNPEIFKALQSFIEKAPSLYEDAAPSDFLAVMPKTIVAFFATIPFAEKMEEIRRNTSTKKAFLNRFYRWFNAFLVLKYVHHARDNYYPDVAVLDASLWLFETRFEEEVGGSAKEVLLRLREIDRAVSQA